MITFHPAARRNAEGSYVPMVTLRADRGRMVGSKLAQKGNTFPTSAEALEHATNAARRVCSSLSFTRVAGV